MPDTLASIPGAPVDPTDAALRPLLAAAGSIALDGFRTVRGTAKADGSMVTAVDRSAESVLVAGLSRAFPQDAVIGEEGACQAGNEATWFVDPLDGTRAFLEGMAHWGPTVARVSPGRVLAGALWLPRIREHFYVRNESEAFLDGHRLPALPRRSGVPDGSLFVPSRLLLHVRLHWPGRTRSLGSIAAHLALVAAGGVEACIVGPGWQPWDAAAGVALVRAVGGVMATLGGSPLDFRSDVGTPFVAGTPRAVAWITTPGRIAPLPDRGHRG